MCVEKINQSKKLFNTSTLYIIFILLGIISGLLNIPIMHSLGTVIAEFFIKIFKFISLPIISLSLIVTLSECHAGIEMRNVWQRCLFYTISTTLIAATTAFFLYILISPDNIINISKTSLAIAKHPSYLNYLINLIPQNIFVPFLEHQIIGVLLVSIIIGIAIRYIPDAETFRTTVQFFKGLHGIFLVITSWIVKTIPLAIFGFIITTIVQFKTGMNIAGIAGYLAVVVCANIVQGLVILPILLYFHEIKPFVTLRAMLPALSMAFFTKSSAGSLAITMETAERNLKVDPKISRFVLPLCTTINMNGCAAFIFTTVIYLMQNHGMEINIMTMLLWIVIASIAAIGNAGVPMGCFFLSISLLTSMNVPVGLMSIILPFYSIIDMIETSLNVWSDSCVSVIIDKQNKQNS